MNRKVLVGIFVISIFMVVSRFYAGRKNQSILSSPQVYGYEQITSDYPNGILSISDLKDSTSLRMYYRELRNNGKARFHFKLQTFPNNKALYVLGYENDSLLMEVICFDDGLQEGYQQGYVLTELTHDSPPAIVE
jgi:hypothetical protein